MRERLVPDLALIEEVAGEDPEAVPALLRLAAVGVEDAEVEVRVARGQGAPEDAVRPDAIVSVAESAGFLARLGPDRPRSGSSPGSRCRAVVLVEPHVCPLVVARAGFPARPGRHCYYRGRAVSRTTEAEFDQVVRSVVASVGVALGDVLFPAAAAVT